MILDVLTSRLHLSRYSDREASMSLSFEVVPNGREYLEVGESYLFASSSHLAMRDQNRTPMVGTISVTKNPADITYRNDEEVSCGFATFHPPRNGDFDARPAALNVVLLVDDATFAELLRLQYDDRHSTQFHVSIDGVEFGWEPDGSHQIWSLEKQNASSRRTVSSFWFTHEQFWTTETSVSAREDNRQRATLAQSPDESDRKLAANLEQEKAPDQTLAVLQQCRTALYILMALAILILFRVR